MSTTLSFVIRDGLEQDIEACLQLDHAYETDAVWQMNIQQNAGQWQVIFKTEHLPRTIEATYPADSRRLHLSLPSDHCFLVAVSRDDGEVFGYLTMRNEPVRQMALIHDLVVSRPFRRNRIGNRLLNVARQWARERQLALLTTELQTKNYPGIVFCQNAGFTFCGFNDRYLPDQDIAVFFCQSVR
jgi:GNAT superfamily N-acetyltransferase